LREFCFAVWFIVLSRLGVTCVDVTAMASLAIIDNIKCL